MNAWFLMVFPVARRRAPSGRSKVSLCQWKTSNSPGKNRCPGAWHPVIARQPSSFSPAYTFLPQAAAIIWAPRQIPRTTEPFATAFFTSAFSGTRNGNSFSSFTLIWPPRMMSFSGGSAGTGSPSYSRMIEYGSFFSCRVSVMVPAGSCSPCWRIVIITKGVCTAG